MDKIQKYEFVKKSREYLDEKKVTALFKNLTKQLLIHRPDSPIDFLINRISKKEPIRVFLIGAPGSIAKMLARRISKEVEFTTISAGELMKKESNRSINPAEVKEEIDQFRVVCDSNLPSIIKNNILKCESEGKNWILEGFPRTKTQVLNLQRIGIIPDIIVFLEVEREASFEKIKRNITDSDSTITGDEIDVAAEKILQEYELQLAQVRESYSKFVNVFPKTKPMDEMEKDLLEMVKLKADDPLLPPGIKIIKEETEEEIEE
ncbi:unnamed protein product [Moneuplotes crassus]|uniref:Adenylate kinase n=1 Tax=Euplotes crassus TaxID=5936 RepID=A0AAD1XRQ4_EUPCR|nr:unnamed protein product [Moneuplotes crassus]